MRAILTELHQAARRMARTPSFTAIAALTLTLGLGANIAIFTVLNGVVLTPLPYDEPDRLLSVGHTAPGLDIEWIGMANAAFVVYRTQLPSVQSIGMYDEEATTLTGLGDPERLDAATVTTELFATLGAAPVLGRGIGPDDERPGAAPVAVIGNGFWRERFGASPDVLGRTLSLDGVTHEIVGVMPAGFAFPHADVRLWRPVTIDPNRLYVTSFQYQAVARLAPGATAEGVVAEMNRVIAGLPELYPNQASPQMLEQVRLGGVVTPVQDDVIGDVSARLWILLAMVGLVLLIACANVANLFLVRTEGRRRELAVRTALGASPGDLARVFFSESAVLAGGAGLLSVGVAWAAVRTLVALAPEGIPRLQEIGMGWPVLAYAAGVSAAAAVILGIIPFLKGRSPSLAAGLREGGRGSTVGRERHLVRHALVVAQVTMALVLMIGSGLLLRSFFLLRSVDPGFDPAGVMTMQFALPEREYRDREARESLFRQLRDGVAEIPGVRAAGLVSVLPMNPSKNTNGYWIDGVSRDGEPPAVHDTRIVLPGYFETMGVPLVTGRLLDDRDAINRTGAVVVSEAFARQHWQTTDVLGRRLKTAMRGGLDNSEPWSTIVGVVGDVHSLGLGEDPQTTVYMPPLNTPSWTPVGMVLTLASDLPDAAVVDRVRSVLARLDPDVPLAEIRSMDEVVSRSTAREAFTAFLLAVAASLAVLLGAVGLYGVISYIYAQRATEIGVRIALGARAADVTRMVVGQSLTVAGLGVAVGLGASLLAAGVLRSFLFGITPHDPAVVVSMPLALLAVAAAASVVPARRAGRVDPATVMRAE